CFSRYCDRRSAPRVGDPIVICATGTPIARAAAHPAHMVPEGIVGLGLVDLDNHPVRSYGHRGSDALIVILIVNWVTGTPIDRVAAHAAHMIPECIVGLGLVDLDNHPVRSYGHRGSDALIVILIVNWVAGTPVDCVAIYPAHVIQATIIGLRFVDLDDDPTRS